MRVPRLSPLVAVVVMVVTACAKTDNPTIAGVANGPTSTASTPAGGGESSGGSGATTGACPGMPSPVNDHGTATATGATIDMQAGDFYFSPTCERAVPPGTTVTLTVHNTGQALHNVSFPAQGIDTDVAPGQTVTVSVKVGGAGQTYAFFCKYHRTSGMAGVLVSGGG